MKRMLMLALALTLVGGVSRADHIAPYSDATGTGCNLPAGFSTTGAIIHKFTLGATGSRFKLDLSLAPGSVFFALVTPFVSIGLPTNDFSVGYGQCVAGSVVVGTMTAYFQPGAISVVAADGFPNVIVAGCNAVEFPATGGHASIAGDGHGCDYDAVEPSTWGRVKSLYR